MKLRLCDRHFGLLLLLFGFQCSSQDDRPSDLSSELSELVTWEGSAELSDNELQHFIQKKNCYWQYKQSCDVQCDQGKIRYHDNCCLCVCKKNYALMHETQCVRAKWTTWSSWSGCLRSNWGGLQTRERVCKAGSLESAGACEGRGSASRTCVPVKKGYRIRKNVRDLSAYEIHDLIQAMTKFKKDSSKNGYRNIISWHGWPGRCPWYHEVHDDNHCSWHRHPMFLPWHRLITVQLEDGLSRYLRDPTLGIPFWDWTETAADIPHLLRDRKIYDPILRKVVDNPFHSSFIKTKHGIPLYTHRLPSYPGLLMDAYLLKGTVRAVLTRNYFNFVEQISRNPHDQIHNCFCWSNETVLGQYRCHYSILSPKYASYDPAFMLHHSAVDRLFAMRRILEDEAGISDWTSSSVAGNCAMGMEKLGMKVTSDISRSFRWPMSPFCNKTMNPNPLTNGYERSTAHKSYYESQLFGYRYSNFNIGGKYSWEDLKEDYKKLVVDARFWNDEYFETKIGLLYAENSKDLNLTWGCAIDYYNPPFNMSISWN